MRALAASEARFRSLIGNATDIITILAADGTILYESPAIERILGYGRDELVGQHALTLVHPDDRGATQAAYERVLGDPTFVPTIEFRFQHRDGSWRCLEGTATNLLDDPDVGGFVVNSRDVTARVEAEAAFARERDLLRTLMDHLPDGVYVKDVSSRFLRLNPAAALTLGITDPAEALGKTEFDFFPEALARQYYEDEQRVIATGEPLLNRLEPQSEDEGSAVWWLTSTVPLRDAAGTIVGIVGSGRNITERLRTEEALRESEARHRALLAALPDLVFRLDRVGTYLDYKSDRLTALLAPPETFIGRTVTEVYPTELAARLMAAIDRVLDGGGAETVEYELAVAGDLREFEARLVAAGSDEVVPVVRDITDRKRLEQERRDALEAAQAAHRASSQLLAMLSHELRTPMQAVLGYAELLLAGPSGSLTPEQAEDVRLIQRAAGRLVGFVKQMLDLSRLEAGQMGLKREPVDLAEVIEEVRQEVAPQAADKALALHGDLPPDFPPALGDGMGVHQILLNLVGNAVKFTEAGEVRIVALAVDACVEVAVSDTGIGIAAESLSDIFEEFRQADRGTTRRYDGAGLGLAIARRLAEQQGGGITVASRPGRGSTFTLRLPIAARPTPLAVARPTGQHRRRKREDGQTDPERGVPAKGDERAAEGRARRGAEIENRAVEHHRRSRPGRRLGGQ